ncbi:MAG TPA: GxxExxY protein [Spirochaetia bacterium]|nr:GxxExxY protein [Spirochaetia bacterium]
MDVAVTSEQARKTMPIDELTRIVIACCYKVHAGLGFGFLESVYKRALVYEMGSRGLLAEEEVPLAVRYGSAIVGSYYADIIVDKRLIVEVKAVETLHLRHEIQLVNYLAATGIQDGLLVNFSARKVDVKRKYRTLKLEELF